MRTTPAGPNRRVRTQRNSDYPSGYPWPWSAFLEIRDGNEWVKVDAEDGDTEEDARTEVLGR